MGWRAVVSVGLGGFFAATIRSGAAYSAEPAATDVCHLKTWGIPWIHDWDTHHQLRAGSVQHAARSPQYKRQVLLIRHGQYENEGGSDDSSQTLTPIGVEQAIETGKYLKKLFQDSNLILSREPRFVYQSTLSRARQTSALILEAFPDSTRNVLCTEPLLKEKFPCDPEPPYRHKKASVKSMEEAELAFIKFIHRPLSDETTTDVVIGHANVIRYLLCRSLQIPPEAWLRFSLPHCSVTSIVVSGNGNVSVTMVGSNFHLDPKLQTVNNIAAKS